MENLQNPFLNYVIDWATCKVVTGYPGVQFIPVDCITDLEFTDDVIGLNDSTAAMKGIFDQITRCTAKVGLEIVVSCNGSIMFHDTQTRKSTNVVFGPLLKMMPSP